MVEQVTLDLDKPTTETPKPKSSSDRWIASDMIFLTGGKGYGIAANGDTVCIGDEKDIQAYLAGGVMSENIRGLGRQVLIEIKEFLKESEDARANTGESFRAVKARHQRSRPARSAERRTASVKRLSVRKRLPGSKA